MSGKCIGLVTKLFELICILIKSEFVVLQYIYHTLVILSKHWIARTQNSANYCQMLTSKIRVVAGGDFITVLHHGTRG